jgi:hypothetical protein
MALVTPPTPEGCANIFIDDLITIFLMWMTTPPERLLPHF